MRAFELDLGETLNHSDVQSQQPADCRALVQIFTLTDGM
jgi:hypothetical protein